jgi:hypothetical protein
MGYGDNVYGAFSESATPAAGPSTKTDYAPILEKANVTLQQDIAALNKVSNNPKSTVKQIQSAFNKLNKSTDAQSNILSKFLSAPTDADIVKQRNTGGDSGLYTSTLAEPLTPAAIPTALAPAVIQPPPPPVKTAPIDTLLFDQESVSTDALVNLIFENIGGQELINITRNDIVNGQQVVYQPIKNLSSIQQQYNPNNILSLQSTSDKYFANFSIKLENRIPNPGTGPNGSYVYLDNNTGNLIIEAINLELDEQVEAEITVSGTIYEAEFGESAS